MSDILTKIGAASYIAKDVSPIDDRTFRDAWAMKAGSPSISVDMDMAREVWRDKIRAARKPELERLDVEYIRAMERGDDVAKWKIASEKQHLRDATQDPAIDAASTPEELKLVKPCGLDVS